MKPQRDLLLMKLGAARQQSPPFSFHLRWDKLCQARRREDRYLLRTNLTGGAATQQWEFYL